MLPSLLLLPLLFLLSALFLSPCLRRLNGDRKQPPGPLAWPVIGNLHLLGTLPHRFFHSLAKRYGPIMSLRLGQVPAVVVSSPEAAELFLNTHDVVFASRPKSQASEILSYGSKGMAFSEYGPYWRNMRKLCTLQLFSASKGLTRRLLKISKKVDEKIETIIREHEEALLLRQNREHKDFVYILPSCMDRCNDQHNSVIDRTNIKAILLDMIAGACASDTSATVIMWAFPELLRNPSVMKKLQLELENQVETCNMVEEADLPRLSYLDMVVKETMRLDRVGPLLIPRVCREDISINGYYIMKHTRIIVNAWSIGRDPKIWSHNVESFCPERFLDSNIDYRGYDFQFLPFGSGRIRGCPGSQLGLITVKLILLVHCFNWKVPEGMSPDELDMTETFGLVVQRANHLLALPSYRLSFN